MSPLSAVPVLVAVGATAVGAFVVGACTGPASDAAGAIVVVIGALLVALLDVSTAGGKCTGPDWTLVALCANTGADNATSVTNPTPKIRNKPFQLSKGKFLRNDAAPLGASRRLAGSVAGG
ncbi:MAG TPA: hypothetical protein VHY09_10010, partial [Candidatus Methylacidiphilales bacterium]|nr:hypothetical protein [Candidatus Methylacidiphilales bacterium]